MIFTALFFIGFGLPWHLTDQLFSRPPVHISSKFKFGAVTFEWTSPTNSSMYNVLINKDTNPGPWTRRENKMIFTALFFIGFGLPWHLTDQLFSRPPVHISSKFKFGAVTFEWTSPTNSSMYNVLINKDTNPGPWTRVYNTQYTVWDVLLFKNISINVRLPESNIDSTLTFKVSKIKTKIGDTVNISWTAAFFPLAGQYNVYQNYRENITIFRIGSSGVSYSGDMMSTKYTYLTRPFNSTNIMFEIRGITLDDAGYYNGGTSADAAWSGGGVVLIVLNKPLKPNITGDFDVEVNRYITLTCSSNSNSAPDYYSKLGSLSYTWFVNETKMGKETRATLRLYVTRNITFNRYSCTATDEDMESDRSDPVQINPLYTSRLTEKRKTNIQELEIENLRLENTKLQKEIKKMEVEMEVLQIKKKFYDVQLQVIRNEHPDVLAQMLKDNKC